MITLSHTAEDTVKWNKQLWLSNGSDRGDANKEEKWKNTSAWSEGRKQMENAKLELEGGSKRGIKPKRDSKKEDQ